jgi:hypothetical protein
VRPRLALALGGGAAGVAVLLVATGVVVRSGALANTVREDSAQAVPPPLLVDYDGDGHPEVIFQAGDHLAIDTLGDGGRVPYPPARGIVFDDVCDVDADGRFDLMTRGPYTSIPEVPPMFVAHAQPDGTFSERDQAAQQALRVTCTDAPPTELARHLVCGRLHGLSGETLRARLPDAGADRPEWVDLLLAVPPFVRLP